jgi:hypothetical protein
VPTLQPSMTSIYFVLLALLAVNIWATRSVWAVPDDWGVPKRMLIAGIWVIPFFGALIAATQIPTLASDGTSPATGHPVEQPDAPSHLTQDGMAPFCVEDHLALVNGLPLLDWRALANWAQSAATPQAQALALEQGRHAWLLHMRNALSSAFHVHATDDAYILSTLAPHMAEATAQYVSKAKRRITRVLANLAQFPPYERSILMVLDTEEDYYHYVSIYYPEEGEFALSGGMFIHAGCPHFVVVRSDLSHVEPVIAHELTHSALAHLGLPKWLDEGLAVNTEHKVAGARARLQTPQQLHAMHQNFWDAQRIQEFWSGASFDRTDDGNLLSYELARIIVEQLARQWDSFARFVAAASYEDAGAAAAQAHLSIRLGAFVAALLDLEPSDSWEPVVLTSPATPPQ